MLHTLRATLTVMRCSKRQNILHRHRPPFVREMRRVFIGLENLRMSRRAMTMALSADRLGLRMPPAFIPDGMVSLLCNKEESTTAYWNAPKIGLVYLRSRTLNGSIIDAYASWVNRQQRTEVISWIFISSCSDCFLKNQFEIIERDSIIDTVRLILSLNHSLKIRK